MTREPSLAINVLARIPSGRAVIADKDPALLAIANDLAEADSRIKTAEVDLAQGDWTEHPLISAGRFDAVISSTALHWLQPGTLVDVYRRLPGLLYPGGIVLNGDHLSYSDRHESTLASIARDDDKAMQQETFIGSTDTWDQWWQAVADTPPLRSSFRAPGRGLGCRTARNTAEGHTRLPSRSTPQRRLQ